MLDIPNAPLLDKLTLLGGCVRLPMTVDAARLAAEVAALPDELWGTTAGRVGVHRKAEAIFLRGHAPAEGDLPVEDRLPLNSLPYVRHIITTQIPAEPLRCLLARLPGGATVPMHVDRAPYFHKTLRVHVPVQTHDRAWMLANNLSYRMQIGEVWVLNNSTPHAVWNADPELARTHLICDFLPSTELLSLIARGERGLGTFERDVHARLTAG